jgi:hypothetical protein
MSRRERRRRRAVRVQGFFEADTPTPKKPSLYPGELLYSPADRFSQQQQESDNLSSGKLARSRIKNTVRAYAGPAALGTIKYYVAVCSSNDYFIHFLREH